MLFCFLIIFSLTFICSKIGWQYHSQSKCNIYGNNSIEEQMEFGRKEEMKES